MFLLILGIFISGIGIVNMMGNISTIHSYNRRKVKEEDIKKYGLIIGLGTLLMGLGMIINYILSFFFSTLGTWIMVVFLIIGIILMLFAQFKYNKGLF